MPVEKGSREAGLVPGIGPSLQVLRCRLFSLYLYPCMYHPLKADYAKSYFIVDVPVGYVFVEGRRQTFHSD